MYLRNAKFAVEQRSLSPLIYVPAIICVNVCNIPTIDIPSFLEHNVSQTHLVIDSKCKELLAIRRIFSLVDIITNNKFSNCPNVFKIGVVWQ